MNAQSCGPYQKQTNEQIKSGIQIKLEPNRMVLKEFGKCSTLNLLQKYENQWVLSVQRAEMIGKISVLRIHLGEC